MISRILYEKAWTGTDRLNKILRQFPQVEKFEIDSVDHYFGQYRKDYLDKRDDLFLYLGSKAGSLVKEAPDAYGITGEPHYYYVHSYNCIYECEYCYLQGYFKNPDLVYFLNFEDIYREIESKILSTGQNQRLWFHAGEYSDSLALSHLSDELDILYPLFVKYPQAQWELRTKSINIKKIKTMKPLKNLFVSFSLSPEVIAKEIDKKTPQISLRLKAIKELADLGFQIGIHLDPMIYHPDFKELYQELITNLNQQIQISQVAYFSVGVVRFTEDVFKQVQKNYPESYLLTQEMTKSFDGKVRFEKPLRFWMMKQVREILKNFGAEPAKIYFCMEDEEKMK